jgi:hypothetical protein
MKQRFLRQSTSATKDSDTQQGTEELYASLQEADTQPWVEEKVLSLEENTVDIHRMDCQRMPPVHSRPRGL